MFNASADQTTIIPGIGVGIQPLTDALQNHEPLGTAQYGVRVQLPQPFLRGRRAAVTEMFMAPLHEFAERRGAPLFKGDRADVFLALTQQDLADLDDPLARMRKTIALASSTAPSALAVSETWDLGRPDQRQAFLSRLDTVTGHIRLASDGLDPLACCAASHGDLAEACLRITPSVAVRCARRQTVLAIRNARQVTGLFDGHTLADGPWQAALGYVCRTDARCAATSDLKEKLKINIARAVLHGLLRPSVIPMAIHLPISTEAAHLLEDIIAFCDDERLYIAIELRDALASFDLYDDMRASIQRAGHRVVLGAESISDASFIDLPAAQADLIRIHRRVGAAACRSERAAWQAQVSQFGDERLILGDIDDEQRLHDGMELGIRYFCGHYIERLATKLRVKGTLAP